MITPARKGRIPENREVVQGRLIENGVTCAMNYKSY